jgi:hypothetical protein
MLENYNLNPYYDDYNDDKNFHRLLFKPSYAVQARELTQIQTILQKQVERFGSHVFKNGSVVTGGQFFFQDSISLKIDNDYSNTTVSVSNFDNKTLLSANTLLAEDKTKRAEVIKVYDTNFGTVPNEPKTIIVKQLYGDAFIPGEIIKTNDASPYYATISANGVTTSKTFSVNEGIFYFEGFFIKTLPQTIAINKYTNANVYCRIGFDVVESVVKASSDTSLLDPALGSSNYQAPGADRVKLDLVLSIRSLESADDEKFIELVRIEQSEITKENKYPIYSVLEDTLARRTYDESGNYVVKPFKISLEDNAANTAQTDVILSPGKAYVYGYEFETSSPTVITVDKPRETLLIQNRRITGGYGNFLYTINHYKSFPINSLGTVDIHCVANASINTTSTATISNTKIGSAKVKTVEYESASNSSNSQTYVYRTFLFDVAINQQITGNVVSATGTSITIGNYSNVENAYQGARLRISQGKGSGEPAKTITASNGSTKILTINQPFLITPDANSVFAIDFDIKEAKSLATHSGTSCLNAANIDDRSKDFSQPYHDVYISDSKLEPMLFPLGEAYIANNTIADMSFTYKRLYTSQQFASSSSPALGLGTNETLSTSGSLDNYTITVIDHKTSPYANGQIIPIDNFELDIQNAQIKVDNGNNMIADIVATINDSGATRKNKTYVAANTTIQTSGGVDVFSNTAVITFGDQGQTHIASTYVNKIPSTAQSLFVSDINNIISILDFKGNSITQANTTNASEVITKYDLDNGQRDSYYDHGSIRLKAGVVPPVGPLVVFYNRFKSTGPGFFTVDSYSGIPYSNIPVYTSPTNNNNYQLRDVLDFRPVRLDATSVIRSNVVFDVSSSTTGPKIIKNNSDAILDYSFYLPRIDKVVLDKTKKFEVIKGNAEIDPVVPNDTDTTMTLYILRNGAYVANTAQIQVEYKNNRRYTMRDIGTLEKRIENLEYFTSLSLLEQDTVTKQDLTIKDANGLQRFKNGILVDGFTGSGVADVTNEDYTASIDPRRKELRPSFNINSYSLTFDPVNSTNYLQSGPFVTSSAAAVSLIDQSKASRYINVNPFNVINYLGKVTLDPASDIWTDTTTKPDVLVNITGDLDAWQYLTQNAGGTEWGNWETRWTGTSINTPAYQGWLGATGHVDYVYAPETKTTTENQTRTGVVNAVVPETITQSIGNRVVDVSVIPYMREKGVLFTGTDFKPGVSLYPFFDNVSVINNVARANKFTFATNDLNYRTATGNPEVVTIKNTTTNSSNGTALIIKTANNVGYVINMNPTTTYNFANMSVVGNDTLETHVVSSYEHYSGVAANVTSNTIILSLDATGATNASEYNNSQIHIISGQGAGQSATIQSYNPTTRTITIDGTWATTPSNTSVYSIGTLKTSDTGAVAGVFVIPAATFRVGEKLFRLVDNNSGDIGSSSTNGDASFYAQGVLQTTEGTVLSATVPTIQRTSVTDSRVVTSTVVTRQVVVGYWDPLAQTFLVSPAQYPQGVFISKVRLCFKGKDDKIPVTLQLRPTVNGYPSSSVVYPHGTVSLTPDKVKVTESPSLDDPTKYTDFTFDAPIYMQPGEHSFVVLANSNKYETYIAEIGKTDMVSNRLISEQAYGGSLFLSQNGSTWTADQNSDMMFRLFRYTFSTSPTVASFLIDYPKTSATPYDLTHLITGDVVMANTSLNYQFDSETISAGGYVGYQPIAPLTDYDMNDGYGTRILNPNTGASTFQLTADLNNLSSEISPFIDTSRMGFLAVNNRINNLQLSNNLIVMTNVGSGYVNPNDITVVISGGNGSEAQAKANVANGTIDKIYFENSTEKYGKNYTATPTITITGGGGTGASAIVIGETSKKGGPAAARYVSRRVTLNDGFDSGDIRVYLTAYRPKESNIYVYVKLLSASDPDTFEDREWQLLTQIGNPNFVSTNANDYREIIFAPGENGVADNAISYTSNGSSYDKFRTFAIKIVMAGTNSADVPKIRDMRAIAIPSVSLL